jgi:Sugar phosphate permease
MTGLSSRTRWLALVILCVGDLMIVVDTTVVNVALPTIQDDLGFSQSELAWVVNAYLLTFGGFLLLAGRLGDLFGHRGCSSSASPPSRSPRSSAASRRRRGC